MTCNVIVMCIFDKCMSKICADLVFININYVMYTITKCIPDMHCELKGL